MKKELNIKKISLTVIVLNLLQIAILVGLMFDQALLDALMETNLVSPALTVSAEAETTVAAPPGPGEKRIELELYEDLKSFGFRISNNGPPISAAHLEKIFEPEFTTKGDEGEGMGLAISRQIIVEHGGKIFVTSKSRQTIFEGQFPK